MFWINDFILMNVFYFSSASVCYRYDGLACVTVMMCFRVLPL